MQVEPFLKANYYDGQSACPMTGFLSIRDQNLVFSSKAEHNPEKDLNGCAHDHTPAEPIYTHAMDTELPSGTSVQLFEKTWSLKEVQFPENLGQQHALLGLPRYASLEVASFEQWLLWSDQHQLNKGIQKYQLKGVWSLLAILLIVLFGVFSWRWGIPFLAEKSVVFISPSIDKKFGEAALEYLDGYYLSESELSAAEQQRIETSFKNYLSQVDPELTPKYRLLFRSSVAGPNAFALPGGDIVMTDEMVDLLEGQDKVLFGVFAHELGHVKNRDSMKSVVQLSALTILINLWIGDFSSTLAAAPLLLGQAQYSRDIERTADSEAAYLLTQAKISPLVMVELFKHFESYEAQQKEELKAELSDKLSKNQSKNDGLVDNMENQLDDLLSSDRPLGIDFSSHPGNQERIQFFKEKAAECKDCR